MSKPKQRNAIASAIAQITIILETDFFRADIGHNPFYFVANNCLDLVNLP
jgi:hypothetical protein